MSVNTPTHRLLPREYPPAVRRAERPTIGQVEAALADAPHLRIGRRLPHSAKFVSRACAGALPREGSDPNTSIVWKDAAAFEKAQELLKNKGYLEERRREALRFRILVGVGTVVATGCVLLAFLK